MTLDELYEYYSKNMDGGTSTAWIKRKEHFYFRDQVRKYFSFIDDFQGRKEFSVYLYALANKITSPPICPVCEGEIRSAHGGSFPKTCSRTCNGKYVADSMIPKILKEHGVEYHTQREDVKEKAKMTALEKYGADHHMKSEKGKESHRQAFIRRHGVVNPFQLDFVKEKIAETNLEKYGVINPMQSDEIRKKAVATNLEKYGAENPLQNSEILEKVKATNIERYGSPSYRNSAEFKERIIQQNIEKWGVDHNRQRHISQESLELLENPEWLEENYKIFGGLRLSKILGVGDGTVYSRLRKFNIEIEPTNTSFAERQVYDFVQSLGFTDAIQSDRAILNGRELDIVIPSKNIAIEFNGIFWHSKKYKPDNYHLEKTMDAKKAGYRLIHIFEDEWNTRSEQIKENLKSILGVDDREKVYARKCKVNIVSDLHTIKNFYNENHLQGSGRQTITFSLEYEGSVAAMMSFTKRTEAEYDLSRFATSKRVVGGFSKLFKSALKTLKEMGVSRLVSFADKRYSEGGVYFAGGWEHEKDIRPDYQYVIDEERKRKQNFRRDALQKKLENFDPSKTEMENMIDHGFYPIYDCGLMKFVFKLDDK